MLPAYLPNARRHPRVRDMLQVPGQQVLHAIHSGERYVVSVQSGAEWQRSACKESISQGRYRGTHLELSNPRQCCHPFTCHRHFAARDFGNRGVRGEKRELGTMIVPPLARSALTACHQRVAAGAGDEVADDAGFDVDGWEHAGRLTTPSAPHNRARKSRSAGGLKRCGGAPLGHPRSQAASSQVRCRATRPAPALRPARGRRRGVGTPPGPGGSGRRCCSASAPPSWAR